MGEIDEHSDDDFDMDPPLLPYEQPKYRDTELFLCDYVAGSFAVMYFLDEKVENDTFILVWEEEIATEDGKFDV